VWSAGLGCRLGRARCAAGAVVALRLRVAVPSRKVRNEEPGCARAATDRWPFPCPRHGRTGRAVRRALAHGGGRPHPPKKLQDLDSPAAQRAGRWSSTARGDRQAPRAVLRADQRDPTGGAWPAAIVLNVFLDREPNRGLAKSSGHSDRTRGPGNHVLCPATSYVASPSRPAGSEAPRPVAPGGARDSTPLRAGSQRRLPRRRR